MTTVDAVAARARGALPSAVIQHPKTGHPAEDHTPDGRPAPDTPNPVEGPPAKARPAETLKDRTAHLAGTFMRTVAALLVVASAFLIFNTVPRSATWEDFAGDVARGDVTQVQTGQAWQVSSGPRTVTMTLGINPGFDRTPIVVWEAHGAPWTAKVPPDMLATKDGTNAQDLNSATASLVTQVADSAGVDPPQLDHAGTTLSSYLARAALCMWPLFALAVLLGPTPRRATKAAWVWLGALPMGLGILAHLVMERPRPGRTAANPARILPGGKAFLFSIAANTAVLTVVTLAWSSLGHP